MEHGFVAWLKMRCRSLGSVRMGIGDDAALLDPPQYGHVVTTDTLCDGTHFELEHCGPRAAGRKLAAVNLSDLAAMAAIPNSIFVSLCLPKRGVQGDIEYDPGSLGAEVMEGVLELCSQYRVAIAGGDTNVWDGKLVISATAIGEQRERGCWMRSSGQPGDGVYVSGDFGGSILGKHLSFTPRLELAEALYDAVPITAATDVTDGLGIDLLNVFAASRCGALLTLEDIPISEAALELSERSGKSALEHAMSDGEDFELLFTVPKEDETLVPEKLAGCKLTKIGVLTSRTGLWAKEKGKIIQYPPNGYVHGAENREKR